MLDAGISRHCPAVSSIKWNQYDSSPLPPSSYFFKWRAHVTPCLVSFNWRHCTAMSRNPSIKEMHILDME